MHRRLFSKESMVIALYRCAHYFASKKKQAFLIFLIGVPILVLYRLFVEWGLNIEIPAKTKIGKGFMLHHGQGLVIHPDTIIGHNVTLRHGTTIGNKDMGSLPSRPPVIEDNVNIGAHVVVIGDITIGKDAIIGAGSVVLMDVPANSVVAGNPAKVIS
jgi:putative colanic acid biosynthesis acetyltransferase WcaB